MSADAKTAVLRSDSLKRIRAVLKDMREAGSLAIFPVWTQNVQEWADRIEAALPDAGQQVISRERTNEHENHTRVEGQTS
jgi:hypothetical protein